MAKGIIVVDMPEHCTICRYSYVSEKYTQWVCGIKNKLIDANKSRPDWCPIKEIPVRLEELKCPHSMSDYQRKGFSRGWNACLYEIEGKM